MYESKKISQLDVEGYNPFFAQAFKTVGNEYRVIPKITHNVVVPYGNAMELLDMLGHGELREKIAILRRLQEYTVSLFDYEYKILNEKHAISIASEDFDICVLNGDYYKGEYGVVTETDMSLLMI